MRRRHGVALFLLLALTAVLYTPHLRHPFIWDDGVQIKDNAAVKRGVPLLRYFTDRETASTLPYYNDRIYRPLRNVMFRQLWHLSDASPKHRTAFFLGANLVLYLMCGLVLFALCRRFTEDPLGPLLATGMWLLLPVHCEDVLYASAFGDLLSCFLQLGALFYLVGALEPTNDHRGRDAIATVVLYVLATLAKEMAITEVLLVAAYILSERRELLRIPEERRRAFVLFAAHVVVTVVYLAVRISLLKRVGQEPVTLRGVAQGVGECGWLLMRYLFSSVAPLGHAPDYGLHHPDGLWRALGWVATLALLALASLAPRRGVRFGAWLFVLSLVPVLRLVPLWTLMADRFALVPSVGLALVVAGLVAEQPSGRRPLVVGLALVGFLLWGAGLSIEAKHFQSDEALWTYSVDLYPDSPLAQHNLGLVQFETGDPEHGLQHLLEAERMGRDIPKLFFHIALTFDLLRRPADAFHALDETLLRDPKFIPAYAMRAQMLRRAGDLAGCERELDRAETIKPHDPLIVTQRGALYNARGENERALELFRAAAMAERDDPAMWQHVAATALQLGRIDDARAAVRTCLEIEPGFPSCKLVERALPR